MCTKNVLNNDNSRYLNKLKELKLTLEFIPITMERSLYQFLKRSDRMNRWKGIKEDLVKKNGKKCQVCNRSNAHLEAHEAWDYQEDTCTQLLKNIQLLCHECHRVKHVNLFYQSKLRRWGFLRSNTSKQDLIDHFCKVNECNEEDFETMEREAFKLLRRRNRISWRKDFGSFYKPVYEKYLLKYNLTNIDFI